MVGLVVFLPLPLREVHKVCSLIPNKDILMVFIRKLFNFIFPSASQTY